MDSKAQAKGVRYYDKKTGAYNIVEAQTIVIASGTVESPKLLLRSVSAFWKKGLGNDQDLVGRNIVTHPWITFQTYLPKNPLKLQPEMAFPTLVSRHFDTEKEQPNGKFILVNPSSTPMLSLVQAMQQGKSRREIDRMVDGKVPIQFNAMFRGLQPSQLSRHQSG